MPRAAAPPKVDVRVIRGGNRVELASPPDGITTAWLLTVLGRRIEGVPQLPEHAVWSFEDGHVSLSW
jgi:hypothetical protein